MPARPVTALPPASFPHQPSRLNPSLAAAREVIVAVFSRIIFSARSHIDTCMSSRTVRRRSARPSRGSSRFSPVAPPPPGPALFLGAPGPASAPPGTREARPEDPLAHSVRRLIHVPVLALRVLVRDVVHLREVVAVLVERADLRGPARWQ